MDVSIVIRTKNEARHIGRTLGAIADQDFKGSYEIIIVDSESSDGTPQIAKRYDVRLIEIRQDEFSYGRSLNVGIKDSRGKFVVNLSAHARPLNDRWLHNLICEFDDPLVAGIYGKQMSEVHVNPLEAYQNECFFGAEDICFRGNGKERLKNVHFSNSNCAIRKAIWERIKFDECVPYAEDTLWQRQVMEAGFSVVYKADAGVHHTHRLTPQLAYRNSKRCAHTSALIDRESHSLSGILRDLGTFCGLIPVSTIQHLVYIWRKRCPEHLVLVPVSVLAMLSGWLAGRLKYRLSRDPGQGEQV